MDTSISRRTALAAGLTGAGALALAACGSDSKDGGTTTAAQPPAGSTPADTTSTSSSAATTSGATGGGTKLAKLDDITVGEAVAAKLDGKPVLVSRPTSSTAACFSAICTHEGCTVAPAGKQLHCPCHNSIYNATTGAVISGPAPRALDKVDVSVQAGEVVTTA